MIAFDPLGVALFGGLHLFVQSLRSLLTFSNMTPFCKRSEVKVSLQWWLVVFTTRSMRAPEPRGNVFRVHVFTTHESNSERNRCWVSMSSKVSGAARSELYSSSVNGIVGVMSTVICGRVGIRGVHWDS